MTGHIAPEPALPSAAEVSAERILAGALWLLTAAPSIPEAAGKWRDGMAAWLMPGALFSAVLVPAALMHAALAVQESQEAPAFLSDLLDVPVFYQPHAYKREGAYVVLLPASASRSWRVPGTVVHTSRALLLVPAVDRTKPHYREPWWVRLPDGPGVLASTALLASLVARGRKQLAVQGSGCDE